MRETTKQRLAETSMVLSLAVKELQKHAPLMKEFLEEVCKMENFGPVMAPSLYRNAERQKTSAIMEPLFRQALALVECYEEQKEKNGALL